MASKEENIRGVLENLRSAVPELRGALVASVEGLPITHLLPSNTDSNRVAAMAATAFGMSRRISDTLNIGSMNESSVSGSDGQIFLYSLGTRGVLALIAPMGANVGLIHLEARTAAMQLSNMV